MAESQCIRVRLKPGKTEEFANWAKSLSGRKDEVRESLRAEGMLSELIFIERTPAGDFVLFYTKAESLLAANQAFERSKLPLDIEAKRVMADTWDFSQIQLLEGLAELTNS